MFSCVYCGFNMCRSEVWWCAEQHHINSRIDYLLKTVKPEKTVFIRYFHILLFFNLFAALIKFILKNIA